MLEQAPDMWEAILAGAKAITYGATLAASGGVAFLAYCHGLIGGPQDARIRRLMRVLLAAAGLASVARICATAASMTGEASGMLDPALTGMILATGEGPASALRLTGLALMLPTLIGHRRPSAAAWTGALLAATSFAWIGHVHALAAAGPTLLIVVHLLGAAFWLGALLPLLIVAADTDVARVATATARFGSAALFIVGALVAAGVGLLTVLVGGLHELWESAYGRFFLAKISLVGALLALAALNRWRVTPRLLGRDPHAIAALRRSLQVEVSLAILVLVVTAMLTTFAGAPALSQGQSVQRDGSSTSTL
jgi:putative copper export protein